ncbi:hypothetical protein LCY76_14600 [Fictibacillus sp. KIGAM418]|uniref:Lipoprotein n=1 Tax=Fictibacillus marinisediminis TaxID=2878389 RepID=A0A9X1XBR6_9BACL|nr:hypothetical protein [Fictibacillus marinisediminis]MCK6257811.1 hypothetical protein [Fictibacillus marinisediminis]
MKTKEFLLIPLTFAVILSLAGCGTSKQSGKDHSQHEHKKTNTSKPNNSQTGKAIKEELNGLDSIEKDVNKKDFKSAADQFESMHEEYHSTVLPPIEAKNKKMGEDMHGKFDALEAAINSKDKTQILTNVKINRDSLQKAVKELGIQL